MFEHVQKQQFFSVTMVTKQLCLSLPECQFNKRRSGTSWILSFKQSLCESYKADVNNSWTMSRRSTRLLLLFQLCFMLTSSKDLSLPVCRDIFELKYSWIYGSLCLHTALQCRVWRHLGIWRTAISPVAVTHTGLKKTKYLHSDV